MTADAETVLLHELGHCPLGLGHPDRPWDAGDDGIWESTSFTRSWRVAAPPVGIVTGPDFLRGTLDDEQFGFGGMRAQSVSWFRIADNDPVVVDGTIIDINTYSRSTAGDLPAGHSWAANANRVTAEQLGAPNTQAVMYSLVSDSEIKRQLSADDVNMARMARTGQDSVAGTADDYTVELVLVDSCDSGADVIVFFSDVTDDQGNPLDLAGFCSPSGVDFSFPQNPLLARHVSLVSEGGGAFVLTLNSLLDWIFGEEVFAAGFETGDTSEWDVVVAAAPESP